MAVALNITISIFFSAQDSIFLSALCQFPVFYAIADVVICVFLGPGAFFSMSACTVLTGPSKLSPFLNINPSLHSMMNSEY